jgi:tetratricopeptide (TPR) repeat protein
LAGDDLDALDVVDLLSQLVDKSLVVADDNADGGVRYRLFESIRQYAQERLEADGDTAAVRRRHADHYVELAETAGPHLRSRDQLDWIKVVAAEIDNFRAAFDWAVETPSVDHAFRLIAPFTLSMAIGDAARDWAVAAIMIPGGEDDPLFPVVAAWASLEATFSGDFGRADARAVVAEHAQQALDVRLPTVANARAVLAFFRGDLEQVVPHAQEWAELARASGDDYELALALSVLATTRLREPDGLATLEESVRVARDAGILSALSVNLPFLAAMLPIEESERALAFLDEAIEVGRLVGDRWGVLQVTMAKGSIALQRGEWRTALQLALDYFDHDAANAVEDPLVSAGIALCQLGCFEPAAVLIGKADAMAPRNWPDWGLTMLAATDAALLEALGEQPAAALAARGAALEYADAVAYLRAQAESVLQQG